MVKRRNGLLAATFLFAVITTLCMLFAPRTFAHAEVGGTVTACVVKPQTDTVYSYIEEPFSIAASDTNLYVGSFDGTVTVFTALGAYVDTLTFENPCERIVSSGSGLFALSGGRLCDKDGVPIEYEGADTCTDISASGGYIYALGGDKLDILHVNDGGSLDTAATLSRELGLDSSRVARFVSATDGNAFIAVEKAHAPYSSDIYMLDGDGNVSVAFARAPKIEGMVSPESGVLITLQNGEICRYELKNGMLRRVASAGVRNTVSIAAGGGKVYTLTGNGTVCEYDSALDSGKELIASASSCEGFFRRQSNISTRKSGLYVSDFGNDRVVRLTDAGCEYLDFDFIQPSAAVSDNIGNIYVAHNMDCIDIFDSSLSHINSVTLAGAVIDDLKFDPLNNLYALTHDGKVWRLASGASEFTAFVGGESGFAAIAFAAGGETLYGLKSGEIHALDAESSTRLFGLGNASVDFTTDIADNFYVLEESGNVVKYYAENGYSVDGVFAPDYESGISLAGANRIVISSIKNSFADYGDILISDPVRHCVRKISAADFGVKVIDDSFVPPVLGNAPNSGETGIVRTALYDVDVYEKPMDMTPMYTVAKGRKVLVLDYDTDVGAFAQVFVDDMIAGKGVVGYVYKAQLSDTLPYVAPEALEVTAYNDNTPVYKLPSRYAPKIGGYESLSKNTKLTLLDFVKDYTDDFENPIRWYRVGVYGGEGYVAASDVSINSFEPIFIRPQTNAVILSVDGSTGAPLYSLTDSGYTMMVQQPLVTGTRVEVVGTFDASEKYTQIKYFDATRGTLTGYVETIYLKYDGVGILPVIVIVLLIITVVAIIITLVWRNIANKKKLTKA